MLKLYHKEKFFFSLEIVVLFFLSSRKAVFELTIMECRLLKKQTDRKRWVAGGRQTVAEDGALFISQHRHVHPTPAADNKVVHGADNGLQLAISLGEQLSAVCFGKTPNHRGCGSGWINDDCCRCFCTGLLHRLAAAILRKHVAYTGLERFGNSAVVLLVQHVRAAQNTPVSAVVALHKNLDIKVGVL